MIEWLKPYAGIDAMKQTARTSEVNIPWLTSIPAHWKLARSKRLFTPRKEKAQPDDEQLSATQAYGVIPQKEFESREGRRVVRITQHLDKRAHVERDDFVISMRSFQGGLERAWAKGCIRSSYVVLKPSQETHVGYFAHLFKSQDYIRALQATSNFIRDGQDLNLANFSLVDLPIPPQGEQEVIARFLDYVNARIERTIRAKRKAIALLQEQKQVIIHHAVTRGLDLTVLLKPSGIPWLGDIPKHWEIISLRMRYSVELGKMLDTKRFTGRNSMPYLRNRDVQWDKIVVDDLPTMDITPEESARYTVQKGDLLVCEGGQVGRCAFWDNQLPVCGFQKALHRVRAVDAKRDHPRFFFYQMQLAARRGVFTADGNENTIAHLTCEKLRRHRFAFPPFGEQKAIADWLDAGLQQFQTTSQRLEREIELLREYRTRLVADVVTGKLDVRPTARDLRDDAVEVAQNIAEDIELEEEEPENGEQTQ